MIEMRADRRTRTYERDEDLLSRVRGMAEARADLLVELAKALHEAQQKRAHYDLGCGSVAMFGRRLGLTAFETVRLVKLARAMEADATVEERVLSGTLSIPAAAELADVLFSIDSAEERAEWLDDAQTAPYADTRRKARRRRAELRCGEPVERLEVLAPDSVIERFERARVLASRKAMRQLTRDETFQVVVDAYVDANDPLLVAERKRRVGPTESAPQSRYIPVSVRRAVRRRAGDCCEFPACIEQARVEFAHRRPHWAGGSREAHNILLLCRFHHVMQEARFIVPVGPLDDPLWFRGHHAVHTRDDPDGRPPRGRRERRVAATLARTMKAGATAHTDREWKQLMFAPPADRNSLAPGLWEIRRARRELVPA